jgi:hypothetical protein
MTTGAGTISVILTLSAHEHEKDFFALFSNLGAIFIAIFLMCLVVYICYANASDGYCGIENGGGVMKTIQFRSKQRRTYAGLATNSAYSRVVPVPGFGLVLLPPTTIT